MKSFALISLAASAALIPASALAQDRTVDPPERWEDVPEVQLRTPAPPPPPPGTTWTTPPPPPAAVPQTAPPPMAAPPVVRRVEDTRVPAAPPAPARAPAPVVRHVEKVHAHPAPAPHASAHAEKHGAHAKTMHHGHDKVMVHHGADRVQHVRVEKHGGPHYRRLERGHRVDGYWMGPWHHVRDWNRYGFAEPHGDRRWVRYYDDALLVDRYGTVHDGRYGMEWDDYGWERDQHGIPIYVGDGDYHPDERDYGWVEEHGAYGYGEGDDYYRYAQPGGWYGHPGYYAAYPYWGWGTVTVTETTVTTSGGCCKKVHKAKPHKVKRRYKSAPRGERG